MPKVRARATAPAAAVAAADAPASTPTLAPATAAVGTLVTHTARRFPASGHSSWGGNCRVRLKGRRFAPLSVIANEFFVLFLECSLAGSLCFPLCKLLVGDAFPRWFVSLHRLK